MRQIKPAYRKFLHTLTAPGYITTSAYGFLRTNPPLWDILNRAGSSLYKQYPPKLDEVQRKIVSDLAEGGIAVTHLEELFPGKNLLSDLIVHTERLKGEAKQGITKTFLQYLLGENSVIDLENPFVRFSLEPRVLDIVNSYMSTCSKLIYFELNITNLMSAGAEAMGSQRWHRDPGMRRIIKVFTYLTDVDEQSGPFTYVVQSHGGGNWRRLFPQKHFGHNGRYPPEGAVDRVVPKSDIKACYGRAGTVIFCDTTGMHKGGYSMSKPRIMSTLVYVAEGDVIRPMFRYPADFKERIAALNAVPRYAATTKNPRHAGPDTVSEY